MQVASQPYEPYTDLRHRYPDPGSLAIGVIMGMFWLNLLPGVVIVCAIVGIPLWLTFASWHVELMARTAPTERMTLRARTA